MGPVQTRDHWWFLMMIRRRASLLLAAILALGSAATALAPSAFAEGEPNDTLATANTIAVNNIGDTGATINPSNDTDWFKFTVSPGNYTIQAYDVASSLSSGISTTLYSSSGQWIASDTDGSNNVASQISTSISIAGTYYIRVEGESSSQIGTYKLRVLPEAGHGLTWDAESEPDGARALAPEVALGVANAKSRSFAVTSATLVDSDDVDYIRFTAPRAGVYTVQAFDVATTAAPASHTGARPSAASVRNTVTSSSLSATGSSALPSSDVQPNVFASQPSATSDTAATPNRNSVSSY